MIFTQVDPEDFIDTEQSLPATGRGAWTRAGIEFGHSYKMAPVGSPRIGTLCEKSLNHWAVGAGCYAIQKRLGELGLMAPVGDNERGIYGPKTQRAVREFQSRFRDPESGNPLKVDGIFGRPDARAAFTPLIDAAEKRHGIPNHYLRGQCNHESALDPGAIGYFIYYPEYRGVDRGAFQINSKAHADITWHQAYDFAWAAEYSAKRMRDYHDKFVAKYELKDETLAWRAALLAHNSPVNGGKLANTGVVPAGSAATYLSSALTAVY